MIIFKTILLLVSLYPSLCLANIVRQDENATPKDDGPSHRIAVGINTAWSMQQAYGARTFWRLDPELVGYVYGGLPLEHLWWRGGLRLGYSNDQPEMPQAVRIEEKETKTLVDFGVTYDWYIVPGISAGIGYDFRTTTLKTQAPIDSADSRISRKDTLMYRYVQTGAGLPLFAGNLLIELLLRYHSIDGDSRSHYTVGVETTYGF